MRICRILYAPATAVLFHRISTVAQDTNIPKLKLSFREFPGERIDPRTIIRAGRHRRPIVAKKRLRWNRRSNEAVERFSW